MSGGWADAACPTCGTGADQIGPEGVRCRRGHYFAKDSAGYRAFQDGANAQEGPAPQPDADEGVIWLCDVQPEQVRWAWPGYIPLRGVTVMDGPPAVGKSGITIDLAARVTRGLPMPDGSLGDIDGPAGVLLLSAEDDPAATIRPRFDAAGGDPKRVLLRESVAQRIADGDGGGGTRSEPRPPTLADIDDLERDIQRTGARLMIADPVMAYLPGKIDSYRDQDVRRVLAPLAKLAQRTGTAIVLVRHLRKTHDGNAINAGGGSIGIIGAARSGLLVTKDPDDPEGARRILASTKSNLGQAVPSLAYRLVGVEGGTSRVAWEGAVRYTADELLSFSADSDNRDAMSEAKAFLQELLRNGQVAVKEIFRQAERAGIADATVRRAKKRLGLRTTKGGMQDGWAWSLPYDGGDQNLERCPQCDGPLEGGGCPACDL